ncbi:hypothetical protein SAMN04489761_2490 [Tenacibaculum sp. MAR_2009_124]|uniref:hypothetical protein n=1 Tax=Tenacibaculum sp. MAR_2009_124 TaxID=1250059 RepID=UPI000899E848|nr:hypothetical protein [Tenacibaculum sp. MAR_2009_124]SEC25162.1 hypothetical protein SAMN04489761_2490 [Tenacibaculum sp. MAR_2009_124]
MEIITVECENCKSESEIREEKLMFSETKATEEAYCPECEEKIYEGQTDGWFNVEKVASESKKDEECKYPMP